MIPRHARALNELPADARGERMTRAAEYMVGHRIERYHLLLRSYAPLRRFEMDWWSCGEC